MDALTLSRLQFAFTIGFHILWPTFSVGIASFVAWLSFLWRRTGRAVYRELMRFWIRIFAIGFGIGVVTGVALSYEIGANGGDDRTGRPCRKSRIKFSFSTAARRTDRFVHRRIARGDRRLRFTRANKSYHRLTCRNGAVRSL